jgi:Protein of unknown function (DUF3299)
MSNTFAANTPEVLSRPESDVYQAMSRAAVISIVFAVLGISSLSVAFLLLLPLIGFFSGVLALQSIKRFPDELLGKSLAQVGIGLSAVLLVVAPAYHGYIYATEVPEGYTRVSFFSLMSDTGQPDVPTQDALQWDGKQVFIKGYVHPTSMSTYEAKKFVIVPDLGTCCFGGQPPLTHMIEVTLTGDQYAHKDLRKKRLAGTFSVNPYLKPVDGLQGVYYQLRADILK